MAKGFYGISKKGHAGTVDQYQQRGGNKAMQYLEALPRRAGLVRVLGTWGNLFGMGMGGPEYTQFGIQTLRTEVEFGGADVRVSPA